jgi:anti-sigma B factor antagonist
MKTPSYPASLDALAITRHDDADCVTLVARGEIDIWSGASLELALAGAEQASTRRIVLDLGGLDFIDSSGLHLLDHAQQRAERQGHQFVIADPPAHVRRLLGMTGIAGRFNVVYRARLSVAWPQTSLNSTTTWHGSPAAV